MSSIDLFADENGEYMSVDEVLRSIMVAKGWDYSKAAIALYRVLKPTSASFEPIDAYAWTALDGWDREYQGLSDVRNLLRLAEKKGEPVAEVANFDDDDIPF